MPEQTQNQSDEYDRGYHDGRLAGWNDWRIYLRENGIVAQTPLEVVSIIKRTTRSDEDAKERGCLVQKRRLWTSVR